MEFTAVQIAELLNGEVVGDDNVTVSGLSKIEEGKSQTLSFLANPAYTEYIYSTAASIVIVNRSFEAERNLPEGCTLIKVDDAYAAFAQLLELYNQLQHNKSGIEEGSHVSPSAKIGENVYIGAFVYIGDNAIVGDNTKIYPQSFVGDNAKIGSDCILHSGVKIYADCEIGNKCIIHSGVIIGGDGFGFAPNRGQEYSKVAQIGNVIVEDFVEIGANTTIDRATLGSTVIRKGVKLDNLIQIAHNVEVGENTVIAAQTGVAGSTKIGKNCMIGGQVGIVGHITIADGTLIAAQSGVGADTEPGDKLQGSPAFNAGAYKRSFVSFKLLPKLQQQVDELRHELDQLKSLLEK